nr:nidogen-2-like [Onthophagus taurus]
MQRINTALIFLCLHLLIITPAPPVLGLDKSLLYRYEDGKELPKGDDVSEEVPLIQPITFYGTKYRTIFVNNNGLLSFQHDIRTFYNYEFPLAYPLLAPLYSNVDTKAAGRVIYLETDDFESIDRATSDIRDSFLDADMFDPTSIFIVTWEDVGYHVNGTDKTNTFQVALISDNDDTYVEFLYPENGIQWLQGTGDGSGLPDARAQAGIIAPDGRYYLLPGSGSERIRNLERLSNRGLPGQWMFKIGEVDQTKDIEVPDLYDEVDVAPKRCAESSSLCHSQGKCVDYDDGFCCECKSQYYGNGKHCVKRDADFRVTGKVNGEINGEVFENLDLQCYVVMRDARIYTAVSKVPKEIGYSSQTLQILGSTMGWVFAKPVKTALNGFQLTGGIFNHTAEIHYPLTNNTLIINQKYLGLDVFDRLRLEVDIKGVIPILPQANATITKYTEEYTLTNPGVIQSTSTRILKYNNSRNYLVEVPFQIKQHFLFNYCKYNNTPPGTTWKLRVGNNFIGYEGKEQIIRYGLSNKIGPFEDVDPCEEGRQHCTPNSSCVVDDDTYRCICNPGYHEVYKDGGFLCSDINECQIGSHDCDFNANCINELGGFRCECKPGYEGDGRFCDNAISCTTVTCSENAECIQSTVATCQCMAGFTGDGQSCVPITSQSCYYINNCSPYGYCGIDEESGKYSCACIHGYIGDGYNCTENHNNLTEIPQLQVEITTQEITTKRSDEFTCKYLHNCDHNAECIHTPYLQSTYSCVCKPGYKGDGYRCEEVEESCMTDDICDMHAACTEDYDTGKAICVCNPGYQGNGFTCEPAAKCSSDDDCPINEICAYSLDFNGYECICKDGLVRDTQNICVQLEGNCDGATCHESADCLFDDVLETHYCSCKSEYMGDGIAECKLRPVGCNINNNCGINAKCELNSTSQLYECQCLEGYFGNGFVCYQEKNCNNEPSMCDPYARCVTDASRKFVCECNPGFIGNGTFCKAIPKHDGNFVLLNQGMATLKIPFNYDGRSFIKPVQVRPMQVAVGLDVDCMEGRIYWGDISGKAIRSSNYLGNDKKVFLDTDIRAPEGISIDWVSRNIYWTDANKRTIEVANIDTRLRRVLFKTDLSNPRGIAVHPQRGKLFWSDWKRSKPKIEWSNTDGTGREVFVNETVVVTPNSLVIDFDREHVCYADAGTNSIECIHIDTRFRQTIASNCTKPFGVAVSSDKIYWSDWISRKINVVNKDTLTRLKPISVPLGSPKDKIYEVVAVPDQCPTQYNVCQYKNQCPTGHICLPDGKGSRRCLCGISINSPQDTATCNDM